MTAIMRGNRKTDTRPEVQLRSALHARGLRFRKHFPIRVEGSRLIRTDIAFTKRKVAVFVDGCFWHRCPEHGTTPRGNSDYWGPKLDRNVERDQVQCLELNRLGWQVLRIWEHVPVAEAVAMIVRLIGEDAAESRSTLNPLQQGEVSPRRR